MIGTTNAAGGNVTADMLGIVIKGNSTPVGASIGQYVIVKNSTISGITDGLYNARLEIPANTAIDDTYLSPVSEGGFNLLLAGLSVENGSNANGYYTKFPDGTLVQWKTYYNPSLTVAANSTGVKALGFPIAFKDTNYTVLVNPFGTTVPAERTATAASVSAANWVNINYQNKNAAEWKAAVNYIAIGRWK